MIINQIIQTFLDFKLANKIYNTYETMNPKLLPRTEELNSKFVIKSICADILETVLVKKNHKISLF